MQETELKTRQIKASLWKSYEERFLSEQSFQACLSEV